MNNQQRLRECRIQFLVALAAHGWEHVVLKISLGGGYENCLPQYVLAIGVTTGARY